MDSTFPLDFTYSLGKPIHTADFRAKPEDFIVKERLGFEPSGDGEHLVIYVTKVSENTHWLAQQLADFANLRSLDIGYCGRKDRHGVCSQWFSLHLPSKIDLDWTQLSLPNIKIEKINRHTRKLRPGDHSGNYFSIRLQNIVEPRDLESRLSQIKLGVPNYFGEQRFGWHGSNLVEGNSWVKKQKRFKNKKQRGLIISALRSYLFNQVLSHRVADNNWREKMSGEGDVFSVATGPLWGRGRSVVSGEIHAVEEEIIEPYAEWREALEYCGLSQERRSLVCFPKHLTWQFETEELDEQVNPKTHLNLSFELEAGQFATSVLRELALLNNKAGRNAERA